MKFIESPHCYPEILQLILYMHLIESIMANTFHIDFLYDFKCKSLTLSKCQSVFRDFLLQGVWFHLIFIKGCLLYDDLLTKYSKTCLKRTCSKAYTWLKWKKVLAPADFWSNHHDLQSGHLS